MNNRYREEEKEKSPNVEKEKSPNEEKESTNCETETVVEPEVVENNNNEKVQELEEEVKKLKEQYLRVLADAENFKKRINEERIRERKYGTQSILEKFVSTADIFDKALSVKTDDDKLKNFLSGFVMINDSLKKILEEEGVKKINSYHQTFDPNFHHAVETAWDDKQKEGFILEEYQSGYMFKDRVLRPALVKVNKKNTEENK